MRRRHSSRLNCRGRGISLVESLVTICIAGIVVGAVVPSFASLIERQALRGAAAELRGDLHLLRSEVRMRRQNLRLALRNETAGSCYVIHTGPIGSCTCHVDSATQCQDGSQPLKTASMPAGGRFTLGNRDTTMTFEADRMTVSPTATLRLVGRSGAAIHLVVAITGRVRECSPEGRVPGLAIC
jgi:type IV fimbrial biogenesis protein FimT